MSSALMTSYDPDLMIFRICTKVGQVTVPMVTKADRTLAENEADGLATLKIIFTEGLAAIERQLGCATTDTESWPLGGKDEKAVV